eukprot:5233907-Prymnesium_polylepis.2
MQRRMLHRADLGSIPDGARRPCTCHSGTAHAPPSANASGIASSFSRSEHVRRSRKTCGRRGRRRRPHAPPARRTPRRCDSRAATSALAAGKRRPKAHVTESGGSQATWRGGGSACGVRVQAAAHDAGRPSSARASGSRADPSAPPKERRRPSGGGPIVSALKASARCYAPRGAAPATRTTYASAASRIAARAHRSARAAWRARSRTSAGVTSGAADGSESGSRVDGSRPLTMAVVDVAIGDSATIPGFRTFTESPT